MRRRLGTFAATLAVTFAAGYGVGEAVGPIDDPDPTVPSAPTATTVPPHGEEHP